MRFKHTIILSSIIISFLLSSFVTAEAKPLVLTDNSNMYSLLKQAEYYEDQTGLLGIETIVTRHANGEFIGPVEFISSPGFTDSAYWFRISVFNDRSTVDAWLLQLTYAMLDNIDVYVLDNTGQIRHEHMGDAQPFGQRQIEHRTFLFDMSLPTREIVELFVRIKTTSSMQPKMFLWEETAFNHYNQSNQLAFGIYYGVFLAMLFYNLLVFISIRDKIYLFYVAHVLSFSLFMCCLNGLGYQYVWPDFPGWQSHASATLMCIACFSAILFARALLRLKDYLPRWDKFFQWSMYYFTGLAIASLYLPYTYVAQVCTASSLLLSITLNFIGWLSLKHENQVAKFYVLAWTFFLLGASVYALKTYGLLPQIFITEYAMQIGSMLDVVLLSMVLSYRVKMLQEQNIQIQQQATKELERKVQERTRKLNETLDALSDSYAKVEKLNYTDPLTEIKNRRFFDEFYLHEMKNAIRSKGSIAVMVVDIDHFKQVNDEYGHNAGDKVLVCIGQLIKDNLPGEYEFVARYGGDDFVIVLPFTDKEGALLTAQRIKNSIAELQVVHENRVILTTISIGISAMQPSRETDTHRLITEADRALYEAKELGRDRIRCYHNGDVTLKDVDS